MEQGKELQQVKEHRKRSSFMTGSGSRESVRQRLSSHHSGYLQSLEEISGCNDKGFAFSPVCTLLGNESYS